MWRRRLLSGYEGREGQALKGGGNPKPPKQRWRPRRKRVREARARPQVSGGGRGGALAPLAEACGRAHEPHSLGPALLARRRPLLGPGGEFLRVSPKSVRFSGCRTLAGAAGAALRAVGAGRLRGFFLSLKLGASYVGFKPFAPQGAAPWGEARV